ncbi:hypothetical protein [Leisingera aquaemixtae]|uniref:hypothetical protein n=1 Tax=Leisingera aquaemixtae TaxID=1396826 RepID=UPI0021A2B185|nr:hypothetical protein [Leisingera aquaemixtae]
MALRPMAARRPYFSALSIRFVTARCKDTGRATTSIGWSAGIALRPGAEVKTDRPPAATCGAGRSSSTGLPKSW